jgi:ferrochelatase
MSTTNKKIGVILMTYGSATTANHVEEYFREIYGDKVSLEVIEDFKRRYRLVGYSPLIDITRAQAKSLQTLLGTRFVVQAGMRHREPSIARAIAACKSKGATRLIGIILSPQYSKLIMGSYLKSFAAAAAAAGYDPSQYYIARSWPTEKKFIQLLANRAKEALTQLHALYAKPVPIVLTTHSLPERVVANDTNYMRELRQTQVALKKALHMPRLEVYTGYQSAGHTPEKWLKPDLTDVLDIVAQQHTAILIVPIQFLADHLEILYDLDIAGSEQCADRGISYHRIAVPNTDPLFIAALKDIVLREVRVRRA